MERGSAVVFQNRAEASDAAMDRVDEPDPSERHPSSPRVV